MLKSVKRGEIWQKVLGLIPDVKPRKGSALDCVRKLNDTFAINEDAWWQTLEFLEQC